MEKRFFTVFPDLKLNSELTELFGLVEVEKVTTNRAKNAIRVYILSRRLIDKKTLHYVESEIEKQLFGGLQVSVFFVEKFQLSEQYTVENLFNVYFESIMAELRSKSRILSNIIKKAKCTFEGKHMNIEVEETALNLEKLDELKMILLDIFTTRCGIEAEISYTYKEPHTSKFREQSEKRMELEIAAIVDRIKENRSSDENASSDDSTGSKNATKKEETAKKTEATAVPKEEDKPKTGGFDKNKNGYY